MNYEEWNNSLVHHFFNKDNAFREVIMFVNDELINRLGDEGNHSVKDFVEAIKEGPIGSTKSGMCQKAIQLYEEWRDKGLEFPPYIAYLSFFVLAAGTDGDFSPIAYYPRLWSLLGEDAVGAPPSFDKMGLLWDDLEKWSIEDKEEELGRFVVRIRVKWVHVGIPLSQTLCSREELNRLPILFEKSYLDPTNPPVPEVMSRLIITHGRDIFKPRTLKVFNSSKNESTIYAEALINLVLEELEVWDGITLDAQSDDHKNKRGSGSGLRICIHYDSALEEITAYLRFKTKRRFPEEEINFKLEGVDEALTCSESKNSWSTPIKKKLPYSCERFDASGIDWIAGIKLTDKNLGWTATLHPAKTRVFEEGLEGLKDWIEVRSIERGKAYLIASSGEEVPLIAEWGVEGTSHFEDKVVKGLPESWKLFFCKGIRNSCKDVEVLTMSTKTRLKLSGGIKSRRSATYFDFAPPDVIIENGTGEETVYANGEIISPELDGNTFKLPYKTNYSSLIRITAYVGQDAIGSRSFRLESFDTLPEHLTPPCRDQRGYLLAECDGGAYAIGAIAPEITSSEHFNLQLPYHLSDHIMFIGRSPGEILEWPSEASFGEWSPVWAIVRVGRKNWEVHFCGGPKIEVSKLKPTAPSNDKRARKKWKEVVYINRKKTRLPQLGILKSLWELYLEAALHV